MHRGLASLLFTLVAAALRADAQTAPPPDEEPTSMEWVAPETLLRPDLVLAAPHVGYDLKTEEIARDVGGQLGAAVAIARNFRKPKLGRFFNVNRPTESEIEEQAATTNEKSTDAAKEVFERWLALIQKGHEQRIPFYVEIHGFADTVSVRGSDAPVPLDVVELATVGIDADEARRIKETWQPLMKELGVPPLAIDVLDPEYVVAGETVRFRKHATSTKKLGVLQERYVAKALHFELPECARKPAEGRAAAAAAIARVIAALVPAAARGK